MISDKEIKEQMKKTGYRGEITPYIRKQLEKQIIAEKKANKITKKKRIDKESGTRKTTGKEKVDRVFKTVGKGVKRVGGYLSECSEKYHETQLATEISSNQKTKKRSKKKTSKPAHKSMKDYDKMQDDMMKYL